MFHPRFFLGNKQNFCRRGLFEMMNEKSTTACPYLRCREEKNIHMHDKMSHSAPEITAVDTGLRGCALGPIVVSTEERGRKF